MIDLLQTNLLISLLTEAIADGLFPNESAADFFVFFFLFHSMVGEQAAAA